MTAFVGLAVVESPAFLVVVDVVVDFASADFVVVATGTVSFSVSGGVVSDTDMGSIVVSAVGAMSSIIGTWSELKSVALITSEPLISISQITML